MHCKKSPPNSNLGVIAPWVRTPNDVGKISSSAMTERPRELVDFKKARVNGGTDNHSLKDSH